MIYLLLFIEFFQIGLFAVGGGAATIPFLMELADRYDWYARADVANMLAISESTPGPIGINMATYAGYHAAGLPGGIVATMSLVLPSIIVVVLVARVLKSFAENAYVKAVFGTIRPAVTGLIAAAVVGLMETALFTAPDGTFRFPVSSVLLCLGFFFCMQLKKLKNLHPIVWLLVGAVLGVVLRM